MAADIHRLIAAIVPDIYCKKAVKNKVKDIAKKEGYLKAAEKAEVIEMTPLDFDKLVYGSPFECKGLKSPIEKHELVYDAFGKNLEPIYFWLLDMLNKEYDNNTTKFIDNFVSSPGSGHFSEMGQKASRMHEEAIKILGLSNQLVKAILNLIYDLREFEVRLSLYDKLNKGNKVEKESAMLSLKQVWLDTVDIKRGNTSIKGMALGQGPQFVTLIDAFMVAENEKLEWNGGEIDINETVKRILKQRIGEFFTWLKESEKELRKRFEIEKIYLKSQVNTLKIYARWAKPYLKAAAALEQRATSNAALVTAFNTTLFELMLMGEGKYKPEEDILLPKRLRENVKKKYHPLVVLQLNFRSVPERTQQGGYGFRGRVQTVMTSYALNDEEIKALREAMDKDDVNDMFRQIEGATEESLAQINTDINYYLGNKEEKKKEEKKEEDNPFSALFSFFKSEKENKEKGITKDNDFEKVVRSQAILESRKKCLSLYDNYKKSLSG